MCFSTSLTRPTTDMMAASVEKEGTNVVPTTLTNPEILRYGRQMIVDGVGLPGQEGLKKSKVCTQLSNLCTVRVLICFLCEVLRF